MLAKLDATSNKKEKCISYKDNLGGALQYSKEHSAETDVFHVGRASLLPSLLSPLWLITRVLQNLKEHVDGCCNDFQADIFAAQVIQFINVQQ